MAFYPGQKVVCIISEWAQAATLARLHVGTPVKNAIYTVREVMFIDRGEGVRLVEIRNPIVPLKEGGTGEVGFASTAFRPLQERGTEAGMALLRKLLDSTKAPENTHG